MAAWPRTLCLAIAFGVSLMGWLLYSEVLVPRLIDRAYAEALHGEPHPLVRGYLMRWDSPDAAAFRAHWAPLARGLTFALMVLGVGALVFLHPSSWRGPRASRQALGATKVALLVCAVAFSAVGTRTNFWPAFVLAVYTDVTPGPLPETTARYDLRIIDTDGRSYAVHPHEPLGQPYAADLGHVMRRAARTQAPEAVASYRDYLLGAAARLLPGVEVAALEVWQSEWAVTADSLPPLVLERPVRRARVARFDVAEGRL